MSGREHARELWRIERDISEQYGSCAYAETYEEEPGRYREITDAMGAYVEARVSSARAEVLAKVEAQFDDFAGEVARTCGGPNAEVMPTDRAVVRSLMGRLRAIVAEVGGVS